MEGVALIELTFGHLGNECDRGRNPSSQGAIGINYVHLPKAACFYVEHRTQTEEGPLELLRCSQRKYLIFDVTLTTGTGIDKRFCAKGTVNCPLRFALSWCGGTPEFPGIGGYWM